MTLPGAKKTKRPFLTFNEVRAILGEPEKPLPRQTFQRWLREAEERYPGKRFCFQIGRHGWMTEEHLRQFLEALSRSPVVHNHLASYRDGLPHSRSGNADSLPESMTVNERRAMRTRETRMLLAKLGIRKPR